MVCWVSWLVVVNTLSVSIVITDVGFGVFVRLGLGFDLVVLWCGGLLLCVLCRCLLLYSAVLLFSL